MLHRPLSELYTGYDLGKRTRSFSKYEGESYASVWERFGDGMFEYDLGYHSRNPYFEKVPTRGTDGFQFSPGLTPEDNIEVFDTFLLQTLNFYYHSATTHDELETYIYKLDVEKYESYIDSISYSIINITSVHRFPLFVLLPYYEVHVEPFTGITVCFKYEYEVI
jgi:hypothetical protein